MTTVSLQFGQSAKAAMIGGADQLADAVAATFGPCGRSVLIEQSSGKHPLITRDGVTVADALEADNRIEQIGLRLIRRAAQRVGEEIGDGTTTTIILARALAVEGLKAVEAGIDPMSLCAFLDGAVHEVVAELRRLATPVRGFDDYVKIATISANGDTKLGKIIGYAFESVGTDGAVHVEAGREVDTTWERVPGIEWEGGYVSPYFMTDPVTTHCDYQKPLVLMIDGVVEDHVALLPSLEKAVKAQRPLLIVADGVRGEALRTLVLNKVKNNLRVVAVKAPLFGDRRREVMEDIAVLTSARLISKLHGDNFSLIKTDAIGAAEAVHVTPKRTRLINKKHTHLDLAARASGIRAEMGMAGNTEFQEKNLRERLSKLTGGVAVIRVGGVSSLEISERYKRANAAVCAVQAAKTDGIVPGGASAYLKAISVIKKKDEGAARAGFNILHKALSAPLKQLASNGGFDGTAVAAKMRKDRCLKSGFDVRSGTFCDVFGVGIVDPVRVLTEALIAANSAAGLFITADVVVTKTKSPIRTKTAEEIPFGPEAKDMTADEATGFGLL